MKFKVGDRVRIVKILNSFDVQYADDLYLWQEAIIIEIDINTSDYPYKLYFDALNFKGERENQWWDEEELELIDDSKDKAKLEMFGELVKGLEKSLKPFYDYKYCELLVLLTKAKELMGDD
jgi:hypothetical protein